MKKITEMENGYLFGLFEGDGYKIYDRRGGHYTVEFYLNSVRDKKIIGFLVILLKKLGLNPNLYQDKRFKCKRIRIYSKKLFSVIQKKISLEDKSKGFNIGFISGLIDSEGYIHNKKSYIMVVNTNKVILNDCKKFLGSIGINSSINKRKPSKYEVLDSYRMYISVSFKRLNHLSVKVRNL